MIPVMQTIIDPNSGNCLTAAVASILELDIAEVPNFAAIHGDQCYDAMNEWLEARGLRVLEIAFCDYETFCKANFETIGDYCIITGPSTIPNRSHAVVGQVMKGYTIEIVHNPLPGGLKMAPGWRRVTFIVPQTRKVEQELTFQRFSRINLKRSAQFFNHKLADWSGSDWGNALAGEVGETCNLIKKLRRNEDIDYAEIGKELADVITYADLLAQFYGLDLGECVRKKFNEVSDRRGVAIKID